MKWYNHSPQFFQLISLCFALFFKQWSWLLSSSFSDAYGLLSKNCWLWFLNSLDRIGERIYVNTIDHPVSSFIALCRSNRGLFYFKIKRWRGEHYTLEGVYTCAQNSFHCHLMDLSHFWNFKMDTTKWRPVWLIREAWDRRRICWWTRPHSDPCDDAFSPWIREPSELQVEAPTAWAQCSCPTDLRGRFASDERRTDKRLVLVYGFEDPFRNQRNRWPEWKPTHKMRGFKGDIFQNKSSGIMGMLPWWYRVANLGRGHLEWRDPFSLPERCKQPRHNRLELELRQRDRAPLNAVWPSRKPSKPHDGMWE